MQKYEAVIFDVSDTLVEYTPNYSKIFGDRMRRLGFEVLEEKAKEISKIVNWTIGEQNCREKNGSPHLSESELNDLLDKAAFSCVSDVSNFTQKHITELRKMQLPEQKMSIIPDVIKVLEALQHKYRLAIVSNHYVWLMEYLNTIGLASYFESIIISDIVGVVKPDIRIMQIVLDELALGANSCLYVGDQPMDVLCSKQIGMDCAWINSEDYALPKSIPYKEDYKITSISELLYFL